MSDNNNSNSNNSSFNKLKRSSELPDEHEGEKRVRMNIKSNIITHTQLKSNHTSFWFVCVVC